MPIRNPTLEEWFLAKQLRTLSRTQVSLSATFSVDVRRLVERFDERRPPITALAVRALALCAEEMPIINRAYLRTPFGDRVVEYEQIAVNLPVVIENAGREHLTAIVLARPHQRNVDELAEEIRAARTRPLSSTWLTRLVAEKPNNLIWRTYLGTLVETLVRVPELRLRLGMGGLSVSSRLSRNTAAVDFHGSGPSFTTVSLFVTGYRPGRSADWLDLSFGWDHAALDGMVLRRLVDRFAERMHDPAAGVLDGLSAPRAVAQA